MTVHEYKDIDATLYDIDIIIEELPEYLDAQIEKVEWAISEINKLSRATTCPDELQLIERKSQFKKALKRLKAAK
ncbi:hypothetical protein [Fodinibius sp.]|uniref:hypothetical protein n=1 Tax=Fodinibius sp. TaxID=1872440 RepID=UPI002ACE6CBB|nr:hypothetical protein [Fodinibius sp.]MDZ7660057.1 hypothetical protein [Fodinibius sp.]